MSRASEVTLAGHVKPSVPSQRYLGLARGWGEVARQAGVAPLLAVLFGLGDGCQNPDVSVEQGRGAGMTLKRALFLEAV